MEFFVYISTMITGIYIIKNLKNNKVYIGSATDIKKRWRDHKWYLKENKHHNPHLQASYNKYGLENFEFIIELECGFNNLLLAEERLIKKYKSMNNNYGYNINDPKQIQLGKKCDNKTKMILSERMKGDKNPMYGKLGEHHPKHGIRLSEENKKIISDKMKRKRGSEANASKLKEKDVLKIRKEYDERKCSQTVLAELFNVTQATISDIVRRKSWM